MYIIFLFRYHIRICIDVCFFFSDAKMVGEILDMKWRDFPATKEPVASTKECCETV
jgi:hypothetical protein